MQAYLFPVKFVFNGVNKEIDNSEYTALNHQGHAYVPVRFIAENMDATVRYQEQSKTIFIDQNHDIGIPSIQGYITKVENNRILVVSSKPKNYSSTGGVKEFYDAVWVSNVPNEVKVGQQVQVWFQGGVLTSYPGQARSAKISFITSEKPINATLLEEQVVEQAINTQAYADITIFVIKEVKYDESADKWQIRFKNGKLNTEEQEQIIEIPD
ncbi:DUF3221 domain-containing protein [Paenibacillus plantarum]